MFHLIRESHKKIDKAFVFCIALGLLFLYILLT
jgi:hypothetical protein